jgi:hypothetical protein
MRDVGDRPVASGLANSIYAQESGRDFGEYVLAHAVTGGLTSHFGQWEAGWTAGFERVAAVAVAAAPAFGTFPPNPGFAGGDFWIGTVSLAWSASNFANGSEWTARLIGEGGTGEAIRYGRARLEFDAATRAAGTIVRTAGWTGIGSADLPDHRSFLLGGRGTLPGEPFRAFRGRYGAYASVEWQLPVPFPAIPIGPFVSTGRTATIAPFVAAGWVHDNRSGPLLQSSGGVRPVAGIAIELFHRLLRTEIGVGLRDGGVGVEVDVRRDLWGIL